MDHKRELSELEKEEMMMKMQERISAPLQWPAPDSCQILDLTDKNYNDVLRLIKHHFFPDDPMCSSVKLLEDQISTRFYLDLIRIWIRDTTSLVAISTKTGRVVGTAVARINTAVDRSTTYSRMEILRGDVLEKLMHLKNTLVRRADMYNQLNVETIFRIYIICVHPSHRSGGLYTALLEACIEMAIAMEIPAITGMFTSDVSQELAATLGFRTLSEIHYSRWIVDNVIVFDNPGIGNYSAAFMGIPTPASGYLERIRKERRDKRREEMARRKRQRQ